MLAQIQPAPTQPVWTGKLSSGTCTIDLDLPRQAGCIDCHGDADYHHKETWDCTICHVGEVGSDNFGVNTESCAQCHPRDGVYGRRQILGSAGEFDMASKHISGTIEDKDCLLCHDNKQHRNGVVSLIDPDMLPKPEAISASRAYGTTVDVRFGTDSTSQTDQAVFS